MPGCTYAEATSKRIPAWEMPSATAVACFLQRCAAIARLRTWKSPLLACPTTGRACATFQTVEPLAKDEVREVRFRFDARDATQRPVPDLVSQHGHAEEHSTR